MDTDTLRLFAPSESRGLGEKIAANLDMALTRHEEREFEDGEHKIRPLENVRNKDVFVIHSLYGDAALSVNDKLCRLLFFLGALKDASASRVTAVLPYLCYARKDRKTMPRDPLTTRYIAQLLETVGTDRIVVFEVHNRAAFQNAFRCHTDHLEAKNLFVEHFAPLVQDRPVVVVSPDLGGAKRAEDFRQALSRRLRQEAGMAFLEKYRSTRKISGEAVVGDLDGKVAIIIDDMISTGGTLARAAQACRRRGAYCVYAAASHGLFVGDADRALGDSPLEQLVISNSVQPYRLEDHAARTKLTLLDTAPLFASAIQRIHSGGSLAELMEPE